MQAQHQLTVHEELAINLGARRERPIPEGASRGRMLIKGSIPDNDATAQDLTASMYDRRILEVGGYTAAQSDPKVILRVERIGLALVEGAETAAILADLLKELELVHTPAGQLSATRRLSMFEYATSIFEAITASKAAAETVVVGYTLKQPETFYVPITPLVVDLERDTFTLGTRTAVNTGANVPFMLFIDGVAHSNAGYVRKSAQCGPLDAKELIDGEARRDRRTAALFARVGSKLGGVFGFSK
jgi:hypothetical protein